MKSTTLKGAGEAAQEAADKARAVIGNVVKEFQGLKSQFKSDDDEVCE